MCLRCSVKTLLMVCLMMPVARADEDRARQSDLELLQGSWQMVLRERNGELTEIGTTYITFRGGQLDTFMNGKSVESGTITLIPNTSPRQYDIKITGNSEDIGHVFHGIYRIREDTLETCVNFKGKDRRPTRFCTEAGSEDQLVVWRRLGAVLHGVPNSQHR